MYICYKKHCAMINPKSLTTLLHKIVGQFPFVFPLKQSHGISVSMLVKSDGKTIFPRLSSLIKQDWKSCRVNEQIKLLDLQPDEGFDALFKDIWTDVPLVPPSQLHDCRTQADSSAGAPSNTNNATVPDH